MFSKIEAFITGLGLFNHAFVSLIAMAPLHLIFTAFGYENAEFIAASKMSFGYYFREVTEAQAYRGLAGLDALNPMKWLAHDRNQQLIVIVATFSAAFIFNTVTK